MLDARRAAHDAALAEFAMRCNLSDCTDEVKVPFIEEQVRLASEYAGSKWDEYQEVAALYRAAIAHAKVNASLAESFGGGE